MNAWLGKVLTVNSTSGFLLGREGTGGDELFPLKPKPPSPLTKKDLSM